MHALGAQLRKAYILEPSSPSSLLPSEIAPAPEAQEREPVLGDTQLCRGARAAWGERSVSIFDAVLFHFWLGSTYVTPLLVKQLRAEMSPGRARPYRRCPR